MSTFFTIYRSSAGSGKTRTLAKEYLKLALRSRAQYYKHILAVTFTNKATQEMKDRILAYLDDFANGRSSSLAEELKDELGLDDSTFQQYAQETQAAILHGYSSFSISTIDAFFQKVIRSFTREAGLVGDYRLELDQDAVLEEVVDNLIDELGTNKELTEWVVEFAKENLENEKPWDIRYNLMEFSREIFREEFKVVEDELVRQTSDRSYFTSLRSTLAGIKNAFLNKISAPAQRAISIIEQQDWDYSDLAYGSKSGLSGFLNTMAFQRNVKELNTPSTRIRTLFTNPAQWPSKATPYKAGIQHIAATQLVPLIEEIIAVYDAEHRGALSAHVALQNLYVFGLIADITRKLKEYKDENNLMLLADAPKFLNGVIQDSDTPFIYEKVGSFYRHYLVDEFQDTSGYQWKNFLPLLLNSLDQGYSNLVVGDVKQAIYRWRGGDLKLLQQDIVDTIGKDRVDPKHLNSNYRSSKNVVTFNNAIFKAAASIVAQITNHAIAAEAYNDVEQKLVRSNEGFVSVQFFNEDNDGPKWKEQVLDQIPVCLENLQAMGASLHEVAFLVRRNEEGQEIISYLINYKHSEKANPLYAYDVVSNESLRIDSAATVSLLEGLLKYLLNPDDDIARAQIAFEFARLYTPERTYTDVFSVTNQAVFESFLPDAFTRQKGQLKKLPLIELTETLIELFKLGEHRGELAYLQTFQNLVLDFFTRERNDLGAFLEWWEDNKHKKSVTVSGQVNAAQILTIHKSKGLQFKYVIIPFCAWNLDHDSFKSPNLWVKVNEAPFDKAGYIPVKYSSSLEDTYFRDAYIEEKTRSHLDNLNLLYVALTRAEQGLIIMGPDPEHKAAKKGVTNLLFSAMLQANLPEEHWGAAKSVFNIGAWSPGTIQPLEESETAESVSLSVYGASSWRKKMVIRQSGKSYFEDADNDKQARIKHGIYVHAVLSKMVYERDIQPVLESLRHTGAIDGNSLTGLEEQLKALFLNAQIRDWFSDRWEVKTEVPILLPGGIEHRIDRLLIRDRKVVVVDFKTGEPSKADERQVIAYLETLRKMNYVDVEGFLLYVKTGDVVSVSLQKTRVIKRRDDAQLDLGIQ